jgi:hypothetical protein
LKPKRNGFLGNKSGGIWVVHYIILQHSPDYAGILENKEKT